MSRIKATLMLPLLLLVLPLNAQDLQALIPVEDRIMGLSQIWSEVKYNFAFIDRLEFDLDSLYQRTLPKVMEAKNNFEYFHLLRKFLSRLNDGHTAMRYDQYYWDQIDYPPVFLRKTDGKYFVERIAEDLVGMIPLGSEVLSVDGLACPNYLQNSASGNLSGFLHSEVTLNFRTPAGATVQQVFTRNSNHLHRTGNSITMIREEGPARVPSVDYAFRVEDELSIVEIGTFSKDTVVTLFSRDIDQINRSKGLILDVRRNGGGNSVYAQKLAGHLVSRDFVVGPLWRTRINHAARRAWGSLALLGRDSELTTENLDYWKGIVWETTPPDTTSIAPDIEKVTVPIVILMGNGTVSAAEDFLIYTLGNDNIIRIGRPSRGSSGQPLYINLPGGFRARICAKRDALPDGSDYIGIGITPDVTVDEDGDALIYAKDFHKKTRKN